MLNDKMCANNIEWEPINRSLPPCLFTPPISFYHSLSSPLLSLLSLHSPPPLLPHSFSTVLLPPQVLTNTWTNISTSWYITSDDKHGLLNIAIVTVYYVSKLNCSLNKEFCVKYCAGCNNGVVHCMKSSILIDIASSLPYIDNHYSGVCQSVSFIKSAMTCNMWQNSLSTAQSQFNNHLSRDI